jgi:hypothetical protein
MFFACGGHFLGIWGCEIELSVYVLPDRRMDSLASRQTQQVAWSGLSARLPLSQFWWLTCRGP